MKMLKRLILLYKYYEQVSCQIDYTAPLILSMFNQGL